MRQNDANSVPYSPFKIKFQKRKDPCPRKCDHVWASISPSGWVCFPADHKTCGLVRCCFTGDWRRRKFTVSLNETVCVSVCVELSCHSVCVFVSCNAKKQKIWNPPWRERPRRKWCAIWVAGWLIYNHLWSFLDHFHVALPQTGSSATHTLVPIAFQ